MGFLYPPASDQTRATLVLLGTEDRKTVLYIYSWDCHDLLPAANTLQPIRHALGKGKPKKPYNTRSNVILAYVVGNT
jgi:hypothetical protein